MIDWQAVGFGALWLTGLSLNLAAFSMADYEANRSNRRLRDVWGTSVYQVLSYAGWALFCFGLLGSARSFWEGGLWVVLGLVFVVFAIQARKADLPKK
jgi:hypothetical protein